MIKFPYYIPTFSLPNVGSSMAVKGKEIQEERKRKYENYIKNNEKICNVKNLYYLSTVYKESSFYSLLV